LTSDTDLTACRWARAELIRRSMDVAPTLEILRDSAFNVIVTQSFVFPGAVRRHGAPMKLKPTKTYPAAGLKGRVPVELLAGSPKSGRARRVDLPAPLAAALHRRKSILATEADLVP